MLLFSKRKYAKELSDEIKTTRKTLKSYTSAIDGLIKQRKRLSSLKGLSDEDRDIQFKFIDEKIEFTKRCRDKCAEELKSLDSRYERMVK